MADEPRLTSPDEPPLPIDLVKRIENTVDLAGACQVELMKAMQPGGRGLSTRKREGLESLIYALEGTVVLLRDVRRRDDDLRSK
jgi:hypothetical protein